MNVRHVGHIFQIVQPGDYCFAKEESGREQVILSCPTCGQAMVCSHEIVNREPLTLAPSVVGPGEKLHCHCGHHFHIVNGEVV